MKFNFEKRLFQVFQILFEHCGYSLVSLPMLNKNKKKTEELCFRDEKKNIYFDYVMHIKKDVEDKEKENNCCLTNDH